MNSIRTYFLLFLFQALVFLQCVSDHSQNEFVLLNKGQISTDPGFSQGVAWGDVDQDGDEDLFVTNSWTNGDNLYYLNNGDGTFSKQETDIISNDGGNSNACTWGDFDNDGDLDLFVANVNDQNNFLYLNNGNGSFSKLDSVEAAMDAGWSYAACWADFDSDGWLDLFVGNYNNQSNFIYYNDGKGALVRDKESLISEENASTQGVACLDYDKDGRMDIYVLNKGKNELYRNLGHRNFEKILEHVLVHQNDNSFGASAADFNNDGHIDLFVANWKSRNRLYRNLGNSEFEALNDTLITTEILNSEGSSWGDLDNDGDLDLIVTNDGNNSLFENENYHFIKRSDWNVCQDSSNSNGVTWNDIDNDGDLDLYVANGGDQPNLLYVNQGNKNNWIKIKCIGTTSNCSAIGTQVKVFQKNKTQLRTISGQDGGGYGSQNGLFLHFGLGKRGKIDSIQVFWPSGLRSIIKDPVINSFMIITEEKRKNKL